MRGLLAGVGIVAVMITTSCGGSGAASGSTASPSPTRSQRPLLESVVLECSLGAEATDSGRTLILDTVGKEDSSGDSQDALECALAKLRTPDFVRQHIDTTRALDGSQTDTWGDFEARWTYHPDDGLQITFIDRS